MPDRDVREEFADLGLHHGAVGTIPAVFGRDPDRARRDGVIESITATPRSAPAPAAPVTPTPDLSAAKPRARPALKILRQFGLLSRPELTKDRRRG